MSHPIVERELVTFLRTRRIAVLQFALAVLFAALVVLRWPTDGRVGMSSNRSLEVFRAFAWGLMIAAMLLGPIFPATTIVRERIKGTLPLLLNSPMRSWSIYLGKLAAILGLVMYLMIVSLPAAAACFAMGGISFSRDLLGLYGLLLVVVVQYCTLALLVSSYANSIDSAIRIMYGIVFSLAVLTLGPYQFLQGHGGGLSDAAEWLRCISPLPALMELLGQQDLGDQGVAADGRTTVRFVALAVGSSLGMMVWTIARLHQHILDRARPSGRITDELGTFERVCRRLVFLIDPQRRKPGIAWFLNPVMVKEFRSRRFGRSHWLLRMVAVSAVVSLTLTVLTTTGTMSWGVETIGAILVILQVGLIVLFAPSLAAGMISTERESGGWDLLRMTPISARRIVIGKLSSVIWPLALVMLATIPGYAVMVYIQPTVAPQVQQVLVCLILTAVFGISLSAAVNSLFRNTAAATVTSYALLLGVYAGTMLVWLGRDYPFSHSTVQTVLLLNPMAAALSVIEVGNFGQYDLIPGNWWFSGANSLILLVVLTVQTWRITRPT